LAERNITHHATNHRSFAIFGQDNGFCKIFDDMWPVLNKLAKGIGWVNERVGEYIAWLNLVLVVLICVDVFNRYVLNISAAWMTELEWHFFALIFILASGYSWKHDRHVRVDLFYVNFSKKDKATVDALGAIFFLVPWSAALLYVCWGYALQSFEIREASPDPGGLPAFYPIKFAVCVGLFLLFLQAISKLIEDLQTWLGNHPEAQHHEE
jgi:TRAP-type mannitol/chloroaromatic compound transport system permease small subunit